MAKLKFDDEKFEKMEELMRLNPRLEDTAAFFKCGTTTVEDTIKKRTGLTFREFRKQNMVRTRMALIQKAVGKALSGDNTMLIFCLKNLCGWADIPEPDDEKPLKYTRPESMTKGDTNATTHKEDQQESNEEEQAEEKE